MIIVYYISLYQLLFLSGQAGSNMYMFTPNHVHVWVQSCTWLVSLLANSLLNLFRLFVNFTL